MLHPVDSRQSYQLTVNNITPNQNKHFNASNEIYKDSLQVAQCCSTENNGFGTILSKCANFLLSFFSYKENESSFIRGLRFSAGVLITAPIAIVLVSIALVALPVYFGLYTFGLVEKPDFNLLPEYELPEIEDEIPN